MKSTLIKIGMICLLGIGLTYCSNGNESANQEAASATEETTSFQAEIEQLDSLSTDLESVKEEIDNNINALEQALEEL